MNEYILQVYDPKFLYPTKKYFAGFNDISGQPDLVEKKANAKAFIKQVAEKIQGILVRDFALDVKIINHEIRNTK